MYNTWFYTACWFLLMLILDESHVLKAGLRLPFKAIST
jgi:hypothetical protein